MNILVNGPQGSGKSTQAKLLAEKLNLNFVDSGDVFRHLASSDLIKEVKEYTDKGSLVPDNVAIKILKSYIDSNCDKNKGFVLNGFPRTVSQISLMENVLGIRLDRVINLIVGEVEYMRRLRKRAKEQQRADETDSAILSRLSEYKTKTLPVLQYYRGLNLVEDVDGERPVEAIFEDILKRLS